MKPDLPTKTQQVWLLADAYREPEQEYKHAWPSLTWMRRRLAELRKEETDE